MKASFLNRAKPPITAMITQTDPESAVEKIEQAIADGADAFGVQLECLAREYRREQVLGRIFAACQGRPIYITSYRHSNSEGMTDDQCARLLLLGLQSGATLCDVMGDLYHPEPWELTHDEDAVEKQRALIDQIHALGGEVMMSSHLHGFFDEQTVVGFAQAQLARGADISKIVTFAQDEDQLVADLRIVKKMRAALPRPFLLLANGPRCHLLRQLGTRYGVCMFLCCTGEGSEQPTVKTARYLRDELEG
jgi:3-dehydroquinate dehydratase